MLGEDALNEVFLKGGTRLAEPLTWDQIGAVRGVQIEVGGGDLRPLRHQHRPFDPVFEFPYIPWLPVGLERMQGLATELRDGGALITGIAL